MNFEGAYLGIRLPACRLWKSVTWVLISPHSMLSFFVSMLAFVTKRLHIDRFCYIVKRVKVFLSRSSPYIDITSQEN